MNSPSTNPAIVLLLFSHARSPPLNPPADLKFDLRQIANPPKNVRDKYIGLDKRLRDEMLREDGFVGLLRVAEREILGLAGTGKGAVGGDQDEEEDAGERRAGSDEMITNTDMDEDVDAEGRDDIAESDMKIIRVSCFCAMGRHRSVAFVEELARCEWPQEWIVEVQHRDVAKSKAAKGGKRVRGLREKGQEPELGELD